MDGVAAEAAAAAAVIAHSAYESFGSGLGAASMGQVSGLVQRLRDRFRGDDHAEHALDEVLRRPDSEAVVALLRDALVRHMVADADFAERVRALLGEAQAAVPSRHTTITAERFAQFEGDTHIGGDFHM
jgi:hypothetical protein